MPHVVDIQLLERFFGGRPEVLEAYLFGSFAKQTQRENSDVDLAVFVEKETPKGAFGYKSTLASDLIRHLKRNDVDLVILNHAPPLLYHRVLRDGVRVYSKDLVQTTLREAAAVSRYCDHRYTMRLAAARGGEVSVFDRPGKM